jgi:hypothetical protein
MHLRKCNMAVIAVWYVQAYVEGRTVVISKTGRCRRMRMSRTTRCLEWYFSRRFPSIRKHQLIKLSLAKLRTNR